MDIEGTFTDIVLRAASGQAWTDQTPTAPEDIRIFRTHQDRHQARHRRDRARHDRGYAVIESDYNS